MVVLRAAGGEDGDDGAAAGSTTCAPWPTTEDVVLMNTIGSEGASRPVSAAWEW